MIAFHAATARRDGALVTGGGRVLGIATLGATLEAAIERACAAAARVSFEGMHYRGATSAARRRPACAGASASRRRGASPPEILGGLDTFA